MSSDIETLITAIVDFRNRRDWKQYHNPKDLAISLNIECSELLEQFLWKDSIEVDIEKLKDELADVFYSALLLAHECNFNVSEIVSEKLKKNEVKYPVNKAFGKKEKYDQL